MACSFEVNELQRNKHKHPHKNDFNNQEFYSINIVYQYFNKQYKLFMRI